MIEAETQGRFWRWGRVMYRRRRIVVLVWAALFVLLAGFAGQAPALFKDNGFTPTGSESDRGRDELQRSLDIPPTSLTLVYSSETLDLQDERNTRVILDSLEELKKVPYVETVAVLSAARLGGGAADDSRDNARPAAAGLANTVSVQAVDVTLQLTTDEALARYESLKALVRAPEGMRVSVTGGTAILYDMQQASKHDIAKAEMIGLPIALVVLLVVFGTLPGALLPLVVGLMSVTVTLGVCYFIGQYESLSNFLPNIVTMLGLAVGIDYALFLVSRFREELKRRADVADAVAMTVQTAGKSIFFSGIAVLIGLLGMLFINLNIFRSLSLGGVLVVTFSVLVANTLLPALLGMLGHKINALRVIPGAFRRGGGASPVWERIAYVVMKRPLALVLLLGAVLVFLMLPVTGMKLGLPNAEVLPPAYESRYGSDLLERTFDAREGSPIHIVVRTQAPVWDESSLRQVSAYEEKLRALPGVRKVTGYPDFLGEVPADRQSALLAQPDTQRKLGAMKLAADNAALLTVVPETHPDDVRTEQLVRTVRELDAGTLQPLVTGATAYRIDMLDRIHDRTPAVLGFVMIVTYFALLAAFRSALLPLKAVLMNVLSLGASLGIVVTVFQHGFMAEALHITSTGYVSATLPIIIFCVVFGISMDYEVFLLSRIIEEYELTGDNERSTAVGLKKTGGLITSAAFILVVVVGSFLFTDIEIMKALGLGLALAVLIDATVIRVVLVPALMKLLGAANWWAPGWLKRSKGQRRSAD